MNCKNCNKNKDISMFRKHRKVCIKCEYSTRKDYIKKWQKENRQRLNEYQRMYQKSKNWFYVPKPKKPKVIKDKNKVRTLSEKDIDLFIDADFLL